MDIQLLKMFFPTALDGRTLRNAEGKALDLRQIRVMVPISLERELSQKGFEP